MDIPDDDTGKPLFNARARKVLGGVPSTFGFVRHVFVSVPGRRCYFETGRGGRIQ
jgi:hypothetical protein